MIGRPRALLAEICCEDSHHTAVVRRTNASAASLRSARPHDLVIPNLICTRRTEYVFITLIVGIIKRTRNLRLVLACTGGSRHCLRECRTRGSSAQLRLGNLASLRNDSSTRDNRRLPRTNLTIKLRYARGWKRTDYIERFTVCATWTLLKRHPGTCTGSGNLITRTR